MTKLSDYIKTAESFRIFAVSRKTLRTWAVAGMIPVRQNPVNRYSLFNPPQPGC